MDPIHVEQQDEVQLPEGDVSKELLENPSNTTQLDDNPESKRMLDLTEKDMKHSQRNMTSEELEALRSDLELQLLEMTTPINELQQLLTADNKILQACTHYRKRTDEYPNFLKKTRTSESLKNIDTYVINPHKFDCLK